MKQNHKEQPGAAAESTLALLVWLKTAISSGAGPVSGGGGRGSSDWVFVSGLGVCEWKLGMWENWVFVSGLGVFEWTGYMWENWVFVRELDERKYEKVKKITEFSQE
jgi:hypothetical protein